MGTKVSAGKTFLCPSGTHVARCVRCIDVGTHTFTSDQYGTTRKHDIILSWELPSALIEEGDYAGEPFVLNRKLTLSLHKKSNLRPILEAWRGKKFTGQEIQDGFEIAEMVGLPCLLTVTHSAPNDEGVVFANVTAVAALMDGMDCGPQVNESLVYDVSTPDGSVYAKLPEWIRKLIDESEENVDTIVQTAKATAPATQQDDIPF